MARPTNTTREFDLLLSSASQKRLTAFQRTLEKSAETIASMKQDLKNLGDAGRALKMAELARRPGALDNNTRLQGVRARRDVAMQAAEEARLYEGAAKAASRTTALELARGRALRNNAAEIAKINTIEEATLKIKAAELRYGAAVIDQDKRKQASALALKAALEARLNTLKAEQAEIARIAKEEEKRAAAQMKQRMQPITDMANARRSRQLSEQRVLGDGGASLFRIQTGLLANYAVLNTLQSGFAGAIQGVVEFDNSLRNLQAIVAVSDGNMAQLRETILSTAESTKFSATEVSEAAVLLGQAGLSGDQIEKALMAVAQLATATGTDLAKAVDTATAIMGAFNLEASRMTEIANTLTSAVNMSKLDMEKLTLGIQYAGNTAYDAGVTFEELTAGLGAMANAGIRSGSTLGTGMRQILVSLEKPSETFVQNLEKLGLSTYDVSLKTKGLAGVMRTLKEAGFSASDAIESFEVRSAAAFIALSNNLDLMAQLEDGFIGSSAAALANETQMRSLKSQYDNFTGALQAVIAEGMQPVTYAIRDALVELNKWLQGIRQNGEELRKWGIIIAQVIAAIAAFKTLSLLTNLVIGFGASIGNLVTTLGAATFALRAYAAGAATAGEAMAFLSAGSAMIAPAIALVVAAVGALTAVYMTGSASTSAYEREQARLTDQMDKVKTAIERTQGVLDSYKQKMEEVDDKLQQLANRQDELKGDTNLLKGEIERTRRQFAGMGYDVTTVDSTVQGLIGKLQALRAQLAQDYTLAVNVQIGNLGALAALKKNAIATNISAIGEVDTSALPQELLGDVAVLRDINATPEQRAAAAGRLGKQLSTISEKTVLPENIQAIPTMGGIETVDTNTYDRNQAKAQSDALAAILEKNAAIAADQDLIQQLGQDQASLRESDTSETQRSTTYAGTFQSIAELPEQINSDLAAIEKRTKGQPTDRMAQFSTYEQAKLQELDSVLATIEADPALTSQNKSDLTSKIEAAKGQLAEFRQKVEPEYFTRQEGLIESDIRLQSRSYGDAMDRISGADNKAQATDAANVAKGLAAKQYELTQQRLMLRVKDGNIDASTQNQLDIAAEEYQRQLDEIDNAVSEKFQRLDKKDNGGKADSGAGRDFNLLMDELKSGMSDTQQDLKYNDIAPAEGLAKMDEILAKAKEELETRRQQMATMKEGSAEYNRLKSEERTLLGFIREEEANIRKEKERQGVAQIDLLNSVKAWAAENLNVSKGLEEGFLNVLGSMKNGLSTLFSDLMSGTKSAKEAFRDFAMSVVESIQNVIAEMMAMYIMKKILGLFGMTLTGGSAMEIVPTMTGGAVRKAAGGKVTGNLARDSKLHMLMPGEYVLRKKAVDMIGVDTLNAMNAMGNRAMATGGHVGVANQKKGPLGQTNVYVVAPEQQPVPGPQDIIAVINDDIARGGSTKKLIKTVAMGY